MCGDDRRARSAAAVRVSRAVRRPPGSSRPRRPRSGRNPLPATPRRGTHQRDALADADFFLQPSAGGLECGTRSRGHTVASTGQLLSEHTPPSSRVECMPESRGSAAAQRWPRRTCVARTTAPDNGHGSDSSYIRPKYSSGSRAVIELSRQPASCARSRSAWLCRTYSDRLPGPHAWHPAPVARARALARVRAIVSSTAVSTTARVRRAINSARPSRFSHQPGPPPTAASLRRQRSWRPPREVRKCMGVDGFAGWLAHRSGSGDDAHRQASTCADADGAVPEALAGRTATHRECRHSPQAHR